MILLRNSKGARSTFQWLLVFMVPVMWTCSHFLALFFQGASLEYARTAFLDHPETRVALTVLLTCHCVCLQYLIHSWTTIRFRFVVSVVIYTGVLLAFLVPTEFSRIFQRMHDQSFTLSDESFFQQCVRYAALVGALPLFVMWMLFPFNGRTVWRRIDPTRSAGTKQLDAWLKLNTSITARFILPVVLSLIIVLVPATWLESIYILPDEFLEFSWLFLLLFAFSAIPLWFLGRIERTALAVTMGVLCYVMGGIVLLFWSDTDVTQAWTFATAAPAMVMLLVLGLLYATSQLPRRMQQMTLRQARENLSADSTSPSEPYPTLAAQKSESWLAIGTALFFALLAIGTLQVLHRSENVFTRVTRIPVSLDLVKVVEKLEQFSDRNKEQWAERPDLTFEAIYRHDAFNRLIRVPIELCLEPWWSDCEQTLWRLGFQLEPVNIPRDFVSPVNYLKQAHVLNVWRMDANVVHELSRQGPMSYSTLRVFDMKLESEELIHLRSVTEQNDFFMVELNRCTLTQPFLEFFADPDVKIRLIDTPLISEFANYAAGDVSVVFDSESGDVERIQECVARGISVRISKSWASSCDGLPLTGVVFAGRFLDLKLAPTRFADCLEKLPTGIRCDFLVTDKWGRTVFVNRLAFPDANDARSVPAKSLRSLACSVSQWKNFCRIWRENNEALPPLETLSLAADGSYQTSSTIQSTEAEKTELPDPDPELLALELLQLEMPEELVAVNLTGFHKMPPDWKWSSWLGDRGLSQVRIDYEGLLPQHVQDLCLDKETKVFVLCPEFEKYRVNRTFLNLPVEVFPVDKVQSIHKLLE